MERFCKEHNLLLWKNFLIQWRSRASLIMQLIVPILLFIIMLLIRHFAEYYTFPEKRYSPVILDNPNILSDMKWLTNLTISYSPENSLIEKLIKTTVDKLKLDGYKAYPNAKVLEEALKKGTDLCGIEFDNALASLNKTLPKKIVFNIRFPSELRHSREETWRTELTFEMLATAQIRTQLNDNMGVSPNYIKEGFLSIQNALSMAYIKEVGKENIPDIHIQVYPISEQHIDGFVLMSLFIIPICIIFMYITPAISLTKQISHEKETQLKEFMLILGINRVTQWISWFTWGFIIFLLPNIILMILFKVEITGPPIFKLTPWSILCLFFFTFTFGCICFSFLCAAIFSRALYAQLFCALIFTSGLFFYTKIIYSFENFDYIMKSLWTTLFINTSTIAYYIFLYYEITGAGLQWDHIFVPPSLTYEMTIGHVIISLIAVGTISWLLCLYLEQVCPGKYGMPRKWNFLCQKNFWSKQPSLSNDSMTTAPQNLDAFEDVITNESVLLHISNLKKKFKSIEVVKGVNLKLYQGETTVLLGHNGAGKTTTIYMITGLLKPTSGTIIINGYNIMTHKSEARKFLGICPQQDVLFDKLTVKNHLKFFCTLKGVKHINAEIEKYLELFQLQKYKNTKSQNLSGGWKRKLCLSCALCGNSKVVLLDEPTSGVDITARYDIWNIIQMEKEHRSILLTTHFMDEADVLGDRIAIMVAGELQCYGTSFFLKKKFVSGYRLVCSTLPNCYVNEVTALLKRYIPNIKPLSNVGAELVYNLPNKYSSTFEKLLSDLEDNLTALGVSGFGIEIASLEDVFLQVGHTQTSTSAINFNSIIDYNRELITKSSLIWYRWWAMIFKKSLYTWNSLCITSILILLPALLLVLFYVLISEVQGHALTISLKQYKMGTIILEKAADIAKLSLTDKIADSYVKYIKSYGSKYEVITLNDQTFTDYILDLGSKKQLTINSEYIAAATISKSHITAWLNPYPLHAAPLTINLLHNGILKSIKDNTYEITVVNKPLPPTDETKKKQTEHQSFKYNSVITTVAFVYALFIIFPMKERTSNSKLIQLMAGANVCVLWATGFLLDLLVYILGIIFLSVTIIVLYDNEIAEYIGHFFLLMFAFGVCTILFAYIVSFIFNSAIYGYLTIVILSIIVTFIGNLETKKINFPILLSFLKIFQIIPSIHAYLVLTRIDETIEQKRRCQSDEMQELPIDVKCNMLPICCKSVSLLTWEKPGMLQDITKLAILMIFYIVILLLIEQKKIFWALYSCIANKSHNKDTDNTLEEDVANEMEKVTNLSRMELKDKRVVLDRVFKKYGGTIVVNRVSLCVESNECFGLLGVNGAGKTTTFKIMTGDICMTAGTVYICGLKLPIQMSKIFRKVSYCPQFSGLLTEFTIAQTLYIFCLIHGIPRQRIPYIINQFAVSLDFTQHLNKRLRNLSGGTQRKVSTALAILGLRDVIFLDEPTTGMDPISKRATWNLFKLARDNGCSLVLCSHSMDECEALCTRISIMVKGQFVCIGSIQHLKNKYATGLILKIRLKSTSTTRATSSRSIFGSRGGNDTSIEYVEAKILKSFPNATVMDSYDRYITFHIPLAKIKYSKVFGFMEKNKASLNIDDYAIYQESLANIFLQVSAK